ncbi:autotransporter strand-loop-strand O-heptosyltransferase [uncultured Phascolarctobacterium sp.]|uniref:autotransporter strand-loop-strand O-heptosyltransferase n=1 Tax=uncultured Phascolarctobacterium sp. TaxID=512296 RepID=UPI0025E93A71|nr:autotransporter strand-loop-strand O-heptosyltransferase [uncultured Phascolarctobacterium sp.]
MPEIKSADAAELTRIMGQAAAASGGTTESGKTGDAAADNDGEAAKAAAPAAAKPYMRFYAGPVTQDSGLEGIKFDFNYGARVEVPAGDYRVRFLDREACLTLYDAAASGVLVTSSKKYFVDFRIEVYEKGKLIFAHDLNLEGKKVLLKFPVGILGDILAWFPYAEIFRKKHKCELYCAMAEDMIEIIKPGYPEIKFIKAEERPEGLYASYYMGIFFPCDDRVHQPVDWRLIGLHQNAAMILGVDPGEQRIRLLPKNKTRRIKEPYVCIAAQASSQAKYWNNGRGWLNVVKHLKELGYRVLCIDRENVYGMGSRYNIIPYGAEDFTGRRPLQERIDLLYHADFFVGLPSGLSWLAYGVGKPVVMISGMSLALTEFPNKYRVQNFHVCNGCWNDTRITFDHKDFEWCPRHKGTDRQFECSRYITPEAVNKVIDRLIADYKLKPQKQAVNKKKIKGEQ